MSGYKISWFIYRTVNKRGRLLALYFCQSDKVLSQTYVNGIPVLRKFWPLPVSNRLLTPCNFGPGWLFGRCYSEILNQLLESNKPEMNYRVF